jgi:glycosyltransferase involved in cell wall biosynthesis
VARYSIKDVQASWDCLDGDRFYVPNGLRLISHEEFATSDGRERIYYIGPGRLASLLRFSQILFNAAYAWRLLMKTGKNDVLLVNGGCPIWILAGMLGRLPFFRHKRMLLWDVFVEAADGWRKSLLRMAIQSYHLIVVWSSMQVESHARWLRMDPSRFVFIPYKTNHSKNPHPRLAIDNYVFAGGNGKRDYQTLVDAVRGTDVTVVISATDPNVRNRIDKLPNVITVAAWEPAFAQLQASSRFIIIPMLDTGIKGGGEANMCNGMWHGKPVIAVDRISAPDYIIDEETGFIVSPGDVGSLRARILELWENPEKCQRIGSRAQKHAEGNFSHAAFIRRLSRLAVLCGRAAELDSK